MSSGGVRAGVALKQNQIPMFLCLSGSALLIFVVCFFFFL